MWGQFLISFETFLERSLWRLNSANFASRSSASDVMVSSGAPAAKQDEAFEARKNKKRKDERRVKRWSDQEAGYLWSTSTDAGGVRLRFGTVRWNQRYQSRILGRERSKRLKTLWIDICWGCLMLPTRFVPTSMNKDLRAYASAQWWKMT